MMRFVPIRNLCSSLIGLVLLAVFPSYHLPDLSQIIPEFRKMVLQPLSALRIPLFDKVSFRSPDLPCRHLDRLHHDRITRSEHCV